MSLQFIIGASGAGKSTLAYQRVIQRSMEQPDKNFILLVPEQQSLAVQKKIVAMHERRGSFNIDCIGFNRLAYRIFDELCIRPQKVLEDFGKSMLLRQAAAEKKDELTVYGSSLSRAGFIDEAKSLMSELYQYDVERERLADAIKKLGESGEHTALEQKMQDMLTIFQAFEEKKEDAYIVAEQMMELVADAVPRSNLIKKSEIFLDGFTGFTPIQLKLIGRLMEHCCGMTVILTMDEAAYLKKKVGEHELFHLPKETMEQLLCLAAQTGTKVDFEFCGESPRWEKGHALAHLERNLFRYPYQIYGEKQDKIRIICYDNPRSEIAGVARQIKRLVRDRHLRYREIAVVSGNLEQTADYVEQIFPDYDIPCFLDYTRPVRNNPCVDALGHALMVVQENFSYDSVFAFLKSGVVQELEAQEIDMLEDAVLAFGKRGIRAWKGNFRGEAESVRAFVMGILQPFYEALSGGKKRVSLFVEQLRALMERLDFEGQLKELGGLYEKICELLDKMVEIMADDEVSVEDFYELFCVGLKDLSLGLVPATIDMTVVGDITRTRLDDIKALFIVGVNDGVIPKRGKRGQLLTDAERETLQALSLHLAPTEKVNSYIEQFYLYLNMTKPKEYLFLSYTAMSAGNEQLRPSYLLERMKNLFPLLETENGQDFRELIGSKRATVETLVFGMNRLLLGDASHLSEILQLYRLYVDCGEHDLLERLEQAMAYSNLPKNLREDVVKLIRLSDMNMSVSKLELYAKCAYQFYLRHVLNLKERQIGAIDRRDMGNILHAALEQIFYYVREHGKWSEISEEQRDALAERFVRECFFKEFAERDMENGQYDFLLRTLIRVCKRTLQKMQGWLTDDMTPAYFEHAFKKDFFCDATKERFQLVGVVDRSDICVDEENKRIKLRVIDYKSGSHEFDLGKLYEGLELQIAIYMDVMREMVDGLYNKNGGKTYEISPEGMYYYHMQDPYVSADSEEAAEAKREKILKLTGLSGQDAETFHIVTEFAKYKAGELAGNIASGKIPKYPMWESDRGACTYCPYKAVCRFDDKHGKNRYHYTKHGAKEHPWILEQMRKKIGGNEHGVDIGATTGD